MPLQKRLGLGAILIGLAILVFMYVFDTPAPKLQSGGGVVEVPDIVEPVTEAVSELIEEVKNSVMTGGGHIMRGGALGTQSLFSEGGTFEQIVKEFRELGFSS